MIKHISEERGILLRVARHRGIHINHLLVCEENAHQRADLVDTDLIAKCLSCCLCKSCGLFFELCMSEDSRSP